MFEAQEKERLRKQLSSAQKSYATAAREIPKLVADGYLSVESGRVAVDCRVKELKRLHRALKLTPPSQKQLNELVMQNAWEGNA